MQATPVDMYRSLTPDQLITLLASRSLSFVGTHEEWAVRLAEDDIGVEDDPAVEDNIYIEDTIAVEDDIGAEDEIVAEDFHSTLPAHNTTIHGSSHVTPTGTPTADTTASSTTYICPDCAAEHETLKAHRRHLVCHTPAQLICPTCAKVLKRKADLLRHMRRHVSTKTWPCDGDCGKVGCERVFTRKDALGNHYKEEKEKLEKRWKVSRWGG